MGCMNRRAFLNRVAAGTAAAAVMSKAGDGIAKSRKDRLPNVILILADDLGYAELNVYGNTFNETPNLNRLAGQGMRFTDAYSAAPVCSPTRASIMTGQHPARVGITDYLRRDDQKFLSPDFYTLAEAMKARGYATGLIGKWHLMGDYRYRRGDPKLHGFDEVVCSETRYIGPGYYRHPYKHLPGVEARTDNEYLTDRLGLEAVDFVTRHKDTPFFLYLNFYSPHTRLDGKKDKVEKYAAKPGAGKERNNPALAAMIESVDGAVGTVMAQLDRLNLADNTVLIFMSDNGGESRVTTNAPLRAGKSCLYEGGIRVPLIVRWPGVARAGTVSDVAVTSTDLYPTIIDAAGADRDRNQVCDGESIVPVLERSGQLDRDALFWHYPLDKPHFLGGRSAGAVRQGAFKLIEFYDTGEVELYNLEEDLGETHNLVPEMDGKTVELRKRLTDWRDEVGGRMAKKRSS